MLATQSVIIVPSGLYPFLERQRILRLLNGHMRTIPYQQHAKTILTGLRHVREVLDKRMITQPILNSCVHLIFIQIIKEHVRGRSTNDPQQLDSTQVSRRPLAQSKGALMPPARRRRHRRRSGTNIQIKLTKVHVVLYVVDEQ